MGRKKIYTDEELRNKYKEYQKNYYEKNKEKISKYRKDYYKSKKSGVSASINNMVQSNGHSFLSPSSLDRALLCPASPSLCEGLPDESTVYSKEGTGFHELMEYDNTFVDTKNLDDYFNSAKELLASYEFSESVLRELSEYWYQTSEFIQTMKDNFMSKGFEITEYKELKLPMYYSSVDSGTLDLGWDCNLPSGKHLILILDYKYGKGVEVEVKHNPQVISYAKSFIEYLKSMNNLKEEDIVNIQTIIYQPRIASPIKRQAYLLEELNKETERINKGVELVYYIYKAKQHDLYDYAVPSDSACKFCKAKSLCKKYNEEMLSLLGDLPQIRETAISNEQIVKILEFEKNVLPKITEYINFVKSSVEDRLLAGDKINGVHLVESKTRTQYIQDTNKIVDVLSKEGIDAVDHSIKLRTISDIKKELSKKVLDKDAQESILNDITYKPDAKLKVELYDDINLVNNLE